jgi:hypothetical protein
LTHFQCRPRYLVIFVTAILGFLQGDLAWPDPPGKAIRQFTAVITDTQGGESEIKDVHFYWEEKVSETAFVPHELREVPVKRGTATVRVKFDQIKQIDVKPSVDAATPTVLISLSNGKTGEFTLAIKGSFKGLSDFGETEFPASVIRKVVFQ